MEARGRDTKDMIASVLCLSVLVLAVVSVPALLQADHQRFAGAVEHVAQARVAGF